MLRQRGRLVNRDKRKLLTFFNKKKTHSVFRYILEQVTGIEPAYLAWKANVLPLNYTCDGGPEGDRTLDLLRDRETC